MTGGTDVDPEVLATVPLLAGLGAAERARLAADAVVRRFAAGEWVFRRDDAGESVFLVLSGRVEILDAAGTVIRVLGVSSAVGELALLTGAPRTASVRVRRDAELLEISAERFGQLLADAPELGVVLARYLARLLQQGPATAERPPSRPRVVAITGDRARVPLARFATAVADAVAAAGERVVLLDGGDAGRGGGGLAGPAALDAAERDHDLVLLVADLRAAGPSGSWRRQADRTLTLVGDDEHADRHPGLAGATGAEIVLVRHGAAAVPGWIAGLPLRALYSCDVRALADGAAGVARRITGRSVGLVLSGGGAPALAHLGVLDAFAARGVVPDRICGAGTGALVGALAAGGRTPDEVARACRALFAAGPRRGLHRLFGDQRIEELPVEFSCVSTDLVRRELVVHRRGRLADALRAATTVPGLAPPVAAGGRLLVDGGLLDGLPVVAMAAGDGPVVAVDALATLRWPPTAGAVAELRAAVAPGMGRGPGPGSALGSVVGAVLGALRAALPAPRIPGRAEVLERVAGIGGTRAAEPGTAGEGRARADLVIRPEPDGTGPREWERQDVLRERGRAAAEAALDEHGPLVR
ncbi:MAG: patatin-like phospholipase family protein [Pseudonocardia sp.]